VGKLTDDGLGDVVVAAPVGGALGETELIQMAGPPCGVFGSARMDLTRIVDQVSGASECLQIAVIWRRRGSRLLCIEGEAEQA
jgi:hypothetical protein